MNRPSNVVAAAALVWTTAVWDRAALAQSSAPADPPALDAAPAAKAPLRAMQGSLLADPTTREEVLSLQDDALVTEILNDEDLMRAIDSGNLEQLLRDPKVRALADHPTVKGIVERQGR